MTHGKTQNELFNLKLIEFGADNVAIANELANKYKNIKGGASGG